MVRNGIRSYLETIKDFDVVGEAESGEEAVKTGLGVDPRYCSARPDHARHGRRGNDAADQEDQPAHAGGGVDFVSRGCAYLPGA
ncbi:MAG: hypothetical protein MZV64_23405 [Ignavibacteriales bacterium]|nr:hypothetical protein [Ignavibacteriales bacterium]